jgi:predicted Zn-dependent protease
VLNALVYDSATAQRQGVANTGHAFPPNNNGLLPDPHPANLFMVPGSADLEDLIASTERGILVTRLHYTRCVEPRAGVVSGITREGTFLIERGRVAYPIRNLRFVEAVIPALSRIQLIGRERRVQWRIAHGPATLSKGMGAITVPAVKISGFRFTGATEF